MQPKIIKSAIAQRFRGYLPVVVDVETGGLNAQTDALLEVAAVILSMNDQGELIREETLSFHVLPFEGAKIEDAALKINGIDPYHPFRYAVSEKQALNSLFRRIKKQVKESKCQRAILVGHNPTFDLNFINAAAVRADIKKSTPFHRFSTFDTATLAGMIFGQTVLAKAAVAAGMKFDSSEAHSAIYDAELTADLFCLMVNSWARAGGWDTKTNKPNFLASQN